MLVMDAVDDAEDSPFSPERGKTFGVSTSRDAHGAYPTAPDAISRETSGFSMDALEFFNDVES